MQSSRADHPLLFVLPHVDVLVELSDAEVAARLGDRPRALRGLDVVALHEVVMPQVLPEGLEQLSFSSNPDVITSLVRRDGRTGGVILRGLQPAQVFEVARSGQRMPHKASYFWPKAVTGLVFRSLA